MMASGPLAPSLPRHRSGGYVRSGRPRVRHRADIHRQGHLAAPERRASSPLRVCVRDTACQARLARHTFAKIRRASVLQEIGSGFTEFRAHDNHDRLYYHQFRSLPVDSIGSTRHIYDDFFRFAGWDYS